MSNLYFVLKSINPSQLMYLTLLKCFPFTPPSSHLHPQDDPLIEPVPLAVLVDSHVPSPRVRHPNQVPEFDSSIDIESFPPQDEFGDSEGDLILNDIMRHVHDLSSPENR
jgi:hypothetical protein